MSGTPPTKHQSVAGNLLILLCNFLENNKLGELLIGPIDIIFSNINIVQPDLIFISKENNKILTDLNIQGAPDLIIEILSYTTIENDRIFKKQIYENFGVKEYWIVDPENDKIEIWELKNKKFQLTIKADKNQVVETQLLKGLQIDLSKIFSD